MAIDEKERLRRWRLVLGKDASEGMEAGGAGAGEGEGEGEGGFCLSGRDQGMIVCWKHSMTRNARQVWVVLHQMSHAG